VRYLFHSHAYTAYFFCSADWYDVSLSHGCSHAWPTEWQCITLRPSM